MLLAGYVTPSYVEKTLKGPQQHSEIEALPAMANPCKRRIVSYPVEDIWEVAGA